MMKYKCHKAVEAFKIEHIEVNNDGFILSSLSTGDSILVGSEYIRKHNPKIGGYFVVYEDGYQSWSPAKAFEEGYTKAHVICLCGSGRFKEAYDKAEFDETLKGNVVLTIGCNTHDIARCPDLEHHKPMLDELHKRKIDLADEVLVLNVGGYIGSSTGSEIDYAKAHGKTIRYLEPTLDKL